MNKIEGRYNTKYPNLPAFHGPLYNMRANSMLRKKNTHMKKEEEENKHLPCFKATTF